jgi:hypothetical protein
MKNRAIRRSQKTRKKIKIKRMMKEQWGYDGELLSEKNVGKNASTHGKPCSCWMCGNPRKHRHQKTKQEVIAELSEKDLD